MIPLCAESVSGNHPDLIAACDLAHLPPMMHNEAVFPESLTFPFTCEVVHSDGTAARVKLDVAARLSTNVSPYELKFPGITAPIPVSILRRVRQPA